MIAPITDASPRVDDVELAVEGSLRLSRFSGS
jgi:hypothetical protein